MIRAHYLRRSIGLAFILTVARPVSVFGQFWRSTASELAYHRDLPQSERDHIYSSVFSAVDSLVRRVWGTPDEWARMRGDSTTQEPLRLVLDPRIWDGSFLTDPSVIGRHDAAWVTDLQNRRFIVGLCDVRDSKKACNEGKATMLIVLSSIAPDGHDRAAVRLTMAREGSKGERGFFSEWTFRLSHEGSQWHVIALEMGPIS